MSKLINDLQFLRKLAVMKVLIVDDQRNMVKTLGNMLHSVCAFKQKSESLLRAYDGDEAIGIITGQDESEKNHIELVLLDWNMPTVPGLEVIRTIRKSDVPFIRDVPVIMITGESLRKDVNNAVHEGVDNYLLKPFLPKDLRERMNPMLRRYWSGLPMKRAVNRRKEPRYNTQRLKMQLEVEFMDDSRMTADVVNISESGVRVEVDTHDVLEIKSIYFRAHDSDGAHIYRIDPVAFMPDIEGEPARVGISMWFKLGFETDEIRDRWLEWIELAKGNEQAFRSQRV